VKEGERRGEERGEERRGERRGEERRDYIKHIEKASRPYLNLCNPNQHQLSLLRL
jgi:hypothetical protein